MQYINVGTFILLILFVCLTPGGFQKGKAYFENIL